MHCRRYTFSPPWTPTARTNRAQGSFSFVSSISRAPRRERYFGNIIARARAFGDEAPKKRCTPERLDTPGAYIYIYTLYLSLGGKIFWKWELPCVREFAAWRNFIPAAAAGGCSIIPVCFVSSGYDDFRLCIYIYIYFTQHRLSNWNFSHDYIWHLGNYCHHRERKFRII